MKESNIFNFLTLQKEDTTILTLFFLQFTGNIATTTTDYIIIVKSDFGAQPFRKVIALCVPLVGMRFYLHKWKLCSMFIVC